MNEVRLYQTVNLNHRDLLSHLKAWFVNQNFAFLVVKIQRGLQVAST